MLPDWPTYLGAPQARGRLRSVPEDFEVEEQFDVELNNNRADRECNKEKI